VQAIRGAEEMFRAENQEYLNVSSVDAWYPRSGVGPVVTTWDQNAHVDLAAWRRLGAHVTQPVQFGYLVNAGRAGAKLPDALLDRTGKQQKLNIEAPSTPLGTPTDAWYVIQGRSDFDKDGIFCNVAATSFSPELYVEHDGE
jgi:hypothetical protein